MRPIVTVLLVLLSCAIMLAQGYAKPLWETTDQDESRALFCANIGGADSVWVGEQEDEGASTSLFVRRVTPDGITVWEQNLDSHETYYHFLQCVRVGPSGNIVVVAKLANSELESGETWLIKMDPNGLILNEAVIDLGDNIVPGIDIASSGAIYVLVLSEQEGYDLVKLDANFDHLWSVDLGESLVLQPSDYDRPRVMDDGTVLVAGMHIDVADETARLTRISSGGAILDQRDFVDGFTPRIEVGPIGELFFAFYATEATNEVRFFRLDYDFETIWARDDDQIDEVNFRILDTGNLFYASRNASDPFEAGYRLGSFNADGSVAWTAVIQADDRTQSLVRGVADNHDLVYFSATSETNVGDMRWEVYCYASDGTRLYEWIQRTIGADEGRPYDMVPYSEGRLLVGGYVNDSGANDFGAAHLIMLQAEAKAFPLMALLQRGRHVAGTVGSLVDDDGDRYVIATGPTLLGEPSTRLEILSIIGPNYPVNGFELRVWSSADRLGLVQEIELWNWRTETWDSRVLQQLTSAEQLITAPGVAADHIHPITRAVRARVSSRSLVRGRRYQISIDQACWFVRP